MALGFGAESAIACAGKKPVEIDFDCAEAMALLLSKYACQASNKA